MKQIPKTPKIMQLLQASLGQEADLSKVAVFEAIALNQLPLRKKHPLYNTSIADMSLLHEMAAAVAQESVPLQIQHDKEPLPVGRVFHAEVVGTELRALYFVDSVEEELIAKIDNGTVDQVSVSIMPKHIYNSKSGFDYLGKDATFDHVWTGTDNDGNTIGENGVYGRLVGLDQWFEMSLVGKGGARNARIVSRDKSHFGSSYERLAASGVDPNALVLVASVEDEDMDLTAIVADLSNAKAEGIVKDQKIATLEATISELNASKETLAAELEAAKADAPTVAAQLTETQSTLETTKVELDGAVKALKDVAQKILTASGKVDVQLPETVAELTALIEDTEKGLSAALVIGGRASEASHEVKKGHISLGAFRTGSRK